MNKVKIKLLSFLSILFIVLNSFFYSTIAYGYNDYNSEDYLFMEDYYNDYDDNYYRDDYEYDYYIKNMNVEVEVNDKRECIVTETIDAYFNIRKHGIIRNIPKSSSLEDYEIKDISVTGADYSVSKSNINSGIDIKIGSEYETVLGDKRYVIKYTLKHYDDGEKDADYLYLNVLGTDWDVPIKDFKSTITYPESFNLETINVTSGTYGSTGNYYADYTLESNKVKIQSNPDGIPEYSGITVNIGFEEGAFLNAPINTYKLCVLLIKLFGAILLLATVISIILSRAKIKSIPKVVEFYPPENMSSLDMSYIYSGVITDEAIVSMIYSWASRGYIKIEMDESKKITLIKLKPLQTEDSYEEELFNAIFVNAYGNPPKVSEKSLRYKLGNVFKKVKKDLKYKYKIDDKYNMKTSTSSMIIRILSFVLIILYVLLKGIKISADFITAVFICGFMFIILYSILITLPHTGYDNSKSFIKNLFGRDNLSQIVGEIIVFLFMQLSFFELSSLQIENMIPTLLPLMSLLLSTMIVPSKTEYEEKIYGRICGFKEFIEKAEKDKLEMLINENPDYFYNVLPYAQALNVTEVWADKFKDIAINPSQNYAYRGTVSDITTMSRALTRVSREATATQSSNSGSSSGGFSGGGFSGGGSGGGGGRSW